MKTSFRKSVAARELPPEWREQGRFTPDERVTVVIEPEDPELANAASLEELMTVIGQRAQERGLTEAKLQDILDDEA
jgi:hypothetical protein